MGGLVFLSFFSLSFTVVTIWLETKACLRILFSFIMTFFIKSSTHLLAAAELGVKHPINKI